MMLGRKYLLVILIVTTFFCISNTQATTITIQVRKNTLIEPLSFVVNTSSQGTHVNCTALSVDPSTIRCNYNGTALWQFDLTWKSISNPTCNITLHVGNTFTGGPGRIVTQFNDYNFDFSPMTWNAADTNVFMSINKPKVLGCR